MADKESEIKMEKHEKKNKLTFKKSNSIRDNKVICTPPTMSSKLKKTILEKIDVNKGMSTVSDDEEEMKIIMPKQNTCKGSLNRNPLLNALPKLSRFSFSSKTPNSSESLYSKMPNFINNYENLLEMITHDSHIDKEKIVAEKRHSMQNTFRRDLYENLKLESIDNYITNIEKKEHKSKYESKHKSKHMLKQEQNLNNAEINSEDNEEERIIILQSLTNTEDIKDFYADTEECLKRIPKLNMPALHEIEPLMIELPFEEELKNKRLAVFDLDETLVHCEIKHPKKGDHQIQVKIPSGVVTKVGLNIRPLVKESLSEIQKNYVIIVYTASHQSYADSVLDFLDPEKELIKYRLYRQNCVKVKLENDFIYVKDMRIFKNIDPKDIIIIDNSVLSFSFQLENGIPILPFYNNKDDEELTFLTNYLTKISKAKDLREENKKSFKMNYFLNVALNDSSIDLQSTISETSEVIMEESKFDDRYELKLNICTTSLDNSINTSLNSQLKDKVEEDFPQNKIYNQQSRCNNSKINSLIQDQLINILSEYKKNLEDKIN